MTLLWLQIVLNVHTSKNAQHCYRLLTGLNNVELANMNNVELTNMNKVELTNMNNVVVVFALFSVSFKNSSHNGDLRSTYR